MVPSRACPRFHPNVYSSACPSRRVMAVLAEKWTLLVVAALADGPMRTAEIRRCVDGVSEKMLIQTLRKLEGYGWSVGAAIRRCRRAWSTA